MTAFSYARGKDCRHSLLAQEDRFETVRVRHTRGARGACENPSAGMDEHQAPVEEGQDQWCGDVFLSEVHQPHLQVRGGWHPHGTDQEGPRHQPHFWIWIECVRLGIWTVATLRKCTNTQSLKA